MKSTANTISKISIEMERLSFLFNKTEIMRHQMESGFNNINEEQSRSSRCSSLGKIDAYFHEEGASAQSIAFSDNDHLHLEGQNCLEYHENEIDAQKSQQGILKELINIEDNFNFIDNNKKMLKGNQKQAYSKLHSGFSSLPQQLSEQQFEKAKKIKNTQNSSLQRQQQKQNNFGKQFKLNCIDHNELAKLQQKKKKKKTEVSTNRKVYKDQLMYSQSTKNFHPKSIHISKQQTPQKKSSSHNLKNKNISKNNQINEKSNFENQWSKNIQKNGKKLNRVNICKFQQGLKKNNDKKITPLRNFNNLKLSKEKSSNSKNNLFKNKLKLKFQKTEQSQVPQNDKNLFLKQSINYQQKVKQLTQGYLNELAFECKETSEEAVFKIRLVLILICFFQDNSVDLVRKGLYKMNESDLFQSLSEKQILKVLTKPKKILEQIHFFPKKIMVKSLPVLNSIKKFVKRFQSVNDQLDQELEYFLIKKTTLFKYLHELNQFLKFLLNFNLYIEHEGKKSNRENEKYSINGFYSSRSKREGSRKKFSKRKDGNHSNIYNCDSERKVDDQLDEIKRQSRIANSKKIQKSVFK